MTRCQSDRALTQTGPGRERAGSRPSGNRRRCGCRELLVTMRNSKIVQPAHQPAGPIKQIELVPLAAVDIERFQPAQTGQLSFACLGGVLAQPVRPALLDDFARVERYRQPYAEKL